MINNYYAIYIQNTFQLAETIAIKFNDAAAGINTALMIKDGETSVNLNDPASWKYYQNISGQYHLTDTLMSVTSLDTVQPICFSKEILKNHPATAKAYRYGSRYYKDIVSRYPEQEMLILGILYFDDSKLTIEDVINSKDGTIVSYPDYLIEQNEYSFISKIQQWIYNYINRWVNFQYTLSDDLYPAFYMGQLYIQLIPLIINTRLSNCKTNEAHSFHIKEYLASYGGLDRYIDILTPEQVLFLYRNILYIQRNCGTRDTFAWLVENILTNRGLPLYEYKMKHDLSKMLPEYAPSQLNYSPNPIFERNQVNFIVPNSVSTVFTQDQVASKIQNVAPNNQDFYSYNSVAVNQQLQDSVSASIGTKLLETVVLDYSDSVPYPFPDILLNEWVFLAAKGIYSAKASITLLKTNISAVMSVKDAFIFYLYAVNKSLGITLTTIPEILVSRVLKPTLPTLAELKNITESGFVSDAELTMLLDTVPTISNIISIDSFYTAAEAIYNSTLLQYKLQAVVGLDNTCAQIQNATSYLYEDAKVTLAEPDTLYSDWIYSFSLNFDNYSKSDFNDLALSILGQATGAASNTTVPIQDIQNAMVSIITQLSSYSVMFISNVDTSQVELVLNKGTRIMYIDSGESSYQGVPLPMYTVIADNTYSTDTVTYDLPVLDHAFCSTHTESLSSLDLGPIILDYSILHKPIPVEVFIPVFTIQAGSNVYQEIAALTLEQKKRIMSVI